MTDLAQRQAYALAHPLSRADDLAALRPLTATRKHGGTGLLLRTILAVDR
jgi:hypothetical protein